MRVAFLFQVPSFWNNWESLYKSMLDDSECEIKIFWIDYRDKGNAQMDRAELFLKSNDIIYETYSYEKVIEFKPDYVVFQTPFDNGHRPIEAWSIRFKLAGIKTVYVPYGIVISKAHWSVYKNFSLATVLNAFAIYTISDALKSIYGQYCVNSDAVRGIGHPRFDCYYEQRDLDSDLRNRIGKRKVVLWKVHFPKIVIENGVRRIVTPDMEEYLKFIDYIEKNPDLFFIFRPHPKFADNTIDAKLRELAQSILDRLKSINNVHIDTSWDYHPSFMNADAIMIDRSALMVEAAVVNVPVLYMYNDNWEEPMHEPIRRLLDSYEQGTTADDMIRFCENVKMGVDLKAEERVIATKETIPLIDGKNGERIKDDLLKHKDDLLQVRKIKRDGNNPVRVAIWGCGELGDVCLRHMNSSDLFQLVCLVDKNYEKFAEEYDKDIAIIPPEELRNMEFDYIVIATDKYFFEVYNQIISSNLTAESNIMNYDEFIVTCYFAN